MAFWSHYRSWHYNNKIIDQLKHPSNTFWRICLVIFSNHKRSQSVKQFFLCVLKHFKLFLTQSAVADIAEYFLGERLIFWEGPWDSLLYNKDHFMSHPALQGERGARGPGFETYLRRVVSLSKTLYSPKVLVNYPGSDGSVPHWVELWRLWHHFWSENNVCLFFTFFILTVINLKVVAYPFWKQNVPKDCIREA